MHVSSFFNFHVYSEKALNPTYHHTIFIVICFERESVHMYVIMYKCTYVCVYVCNCVYMYYVGVYVRMYICT